jgi:hypothetical protein
VPLARVISQADSANSIPVIRSREKPRSEAISGFWGFVVQRAGRASCDSLATVLPGRGRLGPGVARAQREVGDVGARTRTQRARSSPGAGAGRRLRRREALLPDEDVVIGDLSEDEDRIFLSAILDA